jgi:predicted branched-subunit amino acid permease
LLGLDVAFPATFLALLAPWLRQRRLMQPAFHRQRIAALTKRAN